MADTRQIVNWALERKCSFRSGNDWFLPDATACQLSDLRTVANAESDKRVVDGICVTSWTTDSDSSGQSCRIPSSGFPVEERLKIFGGIAHALQTCGPCEANVSTKATTAVAGCFGYLDVWPDSDDLEKMLWEIIENRGLEGRLRSLFHVTTPLWYGFWIRSPLQRPQAELLLELLEATVDDEDLADGKIVGFLNALKAVINWELPLHVSMVPLGHTDLGWYTVFPHCPRCKANAPVGRWLEKYQTDPHECTVCGQTFIPNDHQSSERDDYDGEAHSLEKQLGDHGHEEFTKKFLRHQGCSEEQVEEVIDNHKNGPLLRKIAEVRQQRDRTLRSLRKFHDAKKVNDELPRNLSFALTDDIGLELVLVPSGEFMMGSPQSADQPNESPQHLVRFERPFYIGRFLVTQAQCQAVLGKNPSRIKDSPDLPVDQASWFDCQEFCERLCSRLKRVIRLPSEAEWEFACRAGTTAKFAFGDSLSSEQANFTPYAVRFGTPPTDDDALVREMEIAVESAQTKGERKSEPTPVGSYPPNAWGIYDMHGNVDEWCEDVWHPNYDGAPADGSVWLDGEDKEPFRVMRGGWCSATEFVCTSSSRRQLRADAGLHEEDDDEPDEIMEMFREMMYTPHGFRVVCEVG
jgi:formylglycine-generating enzyme required for sulfatase activity